MCNEPIWQMACELTLLKLNASPRHDSIDCYIVKHEINETSLSANTVRVILFCKVDIVDMLNRLNRFNRFNLLNYLGSQTSTYDHSLRI